MQYFVTILKQFTQSQRLIVLILLLSFTTISVLISQYMKTDDCSEIINENLKMQQDFAKISAMLRKERMQTDLSIDSTSVYSEPKGGSFKLNKKPDVVTEVLKIAESNK